MFFEKLLKAEKAVTNSFKIRNFILGVSHIVFCAWKIIYLENII